jgi:hypothetical protein
MLTDTATCTGGAKLLGGGGQVTTAGDISKTAIIQSYPSSSTVWTVVGAITSGLGGSTTAQVTAYAICGS